MHKKKIVIIFSNIAKSFGFEWFSEYINAKKYQLYFILLNPQHTDMEQYLKDKHFPTYRIKFCSKKDAPIAGLKVLQLLLKIRPDAVHAHFPDAALLSLNWAKGLGIKKRVYTRHFGTIHHRYHPHAIKYDKWINKLSTDIIAITESVKHILIEKEGAKESKIKVIPHGFRLELFENPPTSEIELLQKKYNVKNQSPVIGVISRYTHWKGIQDIIPAFQEILQEFPNALLMLANARGDYAKEIKSMLQTLPQGSFFEIEFENNLFALYKLFDVYVHVPIDPDVEAFGQTYVEALAAGIPSVFTLSGISKEFIKHQENAWVVPFENSTAIAQAIKTLLKNKELRNLLINKGKEVVWQRFDIRNTIKLNEAIYEN